MGLILSPLLLLEFGWRGLFCVFGFLGLPLLLFWLTVVPEAPARGATGAAAPATTQPTTDAAAAAADRQSAGVGPGPSSSAAAAAGAGAGKAGEGGVTVGRLLSSSATWAIIIVNVVNHFGYFIYLNWMPTYFNKVGARSRNLSTRCSPPKLTLCSSRSLPTP